MNPKESIVLSAGEPSGDKLGAQLATDLSQRFPRLPLFGIGGPRMKMAGVNLIADYSPLSVMGYRDVLLSLPAIIAVRQQLLKHLRQSRPSLFIGIDAPDFNLSIARQIRSSTTRTTQYVAPSVWIWRQKRIKNIQKAVDSVWCLLPFEKAIYEKAGIKATFVGHPAARHRFPARQQARQKLGIDPTAPLIAYLPGSRQKEWTRHLPLFAAITKRLQQPGRRFATVAVNSTAATAIQQTLPSAILGEMDDILTAADIVIVKSGTATLEAAMAGTPMIVVFRFSPLEQKIAQWRTFSLPFFSLPNILAQRFIVPELLAEEATADNIAGEAEALLQDEQRQQRMRDVFAQIRLNLVETQQSIGDAAAAMMSC